MSKPIFLFVFFMAALCMKTVSGYTCACFMNQYDHHYLGVMCTAFYVPSMITGWGSPRNEWFTVECAQCSVDYNCTRREPGSKPSNDIKVANLPSAQSQTSEVQKKRISDGNLRQRVAGDPVKCCCYAKKEYYYTKGIHCDALNPESGGYCESEEYGAQLIGQWLDNDMFGHQCFFVVGITANDTRT